MAAIPWREWRRTSIRCTSEVTDVVTERTEAVRSNTFEGMAKKTPRRYNSEVTATLTEPTFGESLRHWRERRRISQLELAIQAGTTQRHLSFVERGRSLPGRGMVIRLAESLNLPLRERNCLLVQAGYAPVYTESTLTDDDMHAVNDALTAILAGHEPYPAMIVTRLGDLVSSNRACDVFFEDVADHLLAEPLNTRRLALHPDGIAKRIRNFEAWAPHVTDSLDRELSRNPDPALTVLRNELAGYVSVPAISSNHIGFAVPLELDTSCGVLKLITTLATFATTTDVYLSELRLEAFLPADEETAERLRRRSERLK